MPEFAGRRHYLDIYRIRYRTERKDPPQDLTLLERILILGRKPQPLPDIPAETRLA